MRTIFAIIRKEFLQVFRNRLMLPILFVVPIVQLIILVNAATLEIKNIRLIFVDHDHSTLSRDIISKFSSSPFFDVGTSANSLYAAEERMKNGEIDVYINFPKNFEKQLFQQGNSSLLVNINGINGIVAGISSAYIQIIISNYSLEWAKKFNLNDSHVKIDITYQHWFNPQLNYRNFMLPAILVILVTMIGMLLSTLNFVREKEIGTIEQINVTPIRKYQFIIGKFLPYMILALIELSIGLIIGKMLYNIPILGNLLNLILFTIIYLCVVMGIGLLVALSSRTQQQALFVLFFIILVSIMLSGVFTSIETMPNWAQKINIFNPIYHFMRVVRMILLKGANVIELRNELVALTIYAITLIQILLLKYKKSTA